LIGLYDSVNFNHKCTYSVCQRVIIHTGGVHAVSRNYQRALISGTILKLSRHVASPSPQALELMPISHVQLILTAVGNPGSQCIAVGSYDALLGRRIGRSQYLSGAIVS
jgi:hypothetical protein